MSHSNKPISHSNSTKDSALNSTRLQEQKAAAPMGGGMATGILIPGQQQALAKNSRSATFSELLYVSC